jgi:hypothetical protein
VKYCLRPLSGFEVLHADNILDKVDMKAGIISFVRQPATRNLAHEIGCINL